MLCRNIYIIACAKRYGRLMALLYLDIDNFRNLNINFNSQVGDLLLQGVAQRITDVLRVEDEVMRVGTDEFAIDGFGRHLNALCHFTERPFTAIKINSHFIQNLNSDDKSTSILKALIAMGNCLDVDVVAEGVETDDQYQLLVKNQCYQAQGFYFSEPVSADQLPDQSDAAHKIDKN